MSAERNVALEAFLSMWYPNADAVDLQNWQNALSEVPTEALSLGVASINTNWSELRKPKPKDVSDASKAAVGKLTQHHPTAGHHESTWEELGFMGRTRLPQGAPTESSKQAIDDSPVTREVIQAAQRIRHEGIKVRPKSSLCYYLASIAAHHECGLGFPIPADDFEKLNREMISWGKDGGDIAWWLKARTDIKKRPA